MAFIAPTAQELVDAEGAIYGREKEREGMRNAIAQQVAKYVAAHRTTSRLTQTALAEKIGVSRQTIAQIELAQTMPSLETLYELAKAFECEAWDLLPTLKQVDGKRP